MEPIFMEPIIGYKIENCDYNSNKMYLNIIDIFKDSDFTFKSENQLKIIRILSNDYKKNDSYEYKYGKSNKIETYSIKIYKEIEVISVERLILEYKKYNEYNLISYLLTIKDLSSDKLLDIIDFKAEENNLMKIFDKLLKLKNINSKLMEKFFEKNKEELMSKFSYSSSGFEILEKFLKSELTTNNILQSLMNCYIKNQSNSDCRERLVLMAKFANFDDELAYKLVASSENSDIDKALYSRCSLNVLKKSILLQWRPIAKYIPLRKGIVLNPKATTSILHKIMSCETDEDILISVAKHPNAGSGILKDIAKNTSNPEILIQVANNPSAEQDIIYTVFKKLFSTGNYEKINDIKKLSKKFLKILIDEAKDWKQLLFIASKDCLTVEELKLLINKTNDYDILKIIAKHVNANEEILRLVLDKATDYSVVLAVLESPNITKELFFEIFMKTPTCYDFEYMLGKVNISVDFLNFVASKYVSSEVVDGNLFMKLYLLQKTIINHMKESQSADSETPKIEVEKELISFLKKHKNIPDENVKKFILQELTVLKEKITPVSVKSEPVKKSTKKLEEKIEPFTVCEEDVVPSLVTKSSNNGNKQKLTRNKSSQIKR